MTEQYRFRPTALRLRLALVLPALASLCYTSAMAINQHTVYVNPASQAVEPFWVLPGDDLRLIIKPKDTIRYDIAWSEIIIQSYYDGVLWSKTSHSAREDIYDVANAFPGTEFMSVIGSLTTRGGGGGGGQMPIFQVTVPEVDIDWDKPGYRENSAEADEDERILWIGPDAVEPFVVRRPIEETDGMIPSGKNSRPLPDLELYVSPTSGLLVYATQAEADMGENAITFPRLIPRETWNNTSGPLRFYAKQNPAQQTLPQATQEIVLTRVGRNYTKPTPFEGDYSGGTYDCIKFRPIRIDLDIWNGGSDLDNGELPGSQGAQVPEGSEVSIGAYLLVNWDDDDADGVMNADGTWATLPVPDLTENSVANEDNLAKLKPTVEPLLNVGTIELEVSGVDVSKVKLWTQRTKGTQITLTSNKKIWNLANPMQKADFQSFMNNGYWIEGTDAGTAKRGVTFTVRYKDSGGTEICKDENKATVVMINLANAVYRDNTKFGIVTRGHAAIAYSFIGPVTKQNLVDDQKFTVRHCPGSKYANPRSDPLSDVTSNPQATARGCYTNPDISYVHRLKILKCVGGLGIGTVTYIWDDLLAPTDGGANTWDGKLNTIGHMRCDAIVEICYEISGVWVWGMERDPDNHALHYNVASQSDEWSYNPFWGSWVHKPNQENDNLEEHNDVDGVDWSGTLMPATQAGYVTPYEADTTFGRQNLCQPVGTKGGNP